MNKIQKRINELLEIVRNDLRDHRLEDAVRAQYNDIFPLSQSIQKMQYEVMEMYETFRMVKESEDDSAKKE